MGDWIHANGAKRQLENLKVRRAIFFVFNPLKRLRVAFSFLLLVGGEHTG